MNEMQTHARKMKTKSGRSVADQAIKLVEAIGGLPELPHGQYYHARCGYEHAADGTLGWVASIYLRTGTRDFIICETRGSKAFGRAPLTNEDLRVFPSRRAMRHAKRLGINPEKKTT